MRAALAHAAKEGLLLSGHYRRALARTSFAGVAVLNYHGLRPDDAVPGSMPFENLHVQASVFDAHCRLVRDTCDPIALDDWRDAIAGHRALPSRAALITFDDGYRSVLTVGAPILAKYGLPAVVFCCPEPMRARRLLWFDHVARRDGEAAVDSWKSRHYDEWRRDCADVAPVVAGSDPNALMAPDEVATLARQGGIEIGAHTARHPILAHATPAQQIDEIASSRDELAEWAGRPVRAFAYPNGRPGVDYTAETVGAVRNAGFDFAFTMQPAFAAADQPALERSRFLIVGEVSAGELAHRLAYAWPR
jgi:peptidoglycan/xylan/chitin deacetylase (PgdA/CDA1 family)